VSGPVIVMLPFLCNILPDVGFCNTAIIAAVLLADFPILCSFEKLAIHNGQVFVAAPSSVMECSPLVFFIHKIKTLTYYVFLHFFPHLLV